MRMKAKKQKSVGLRKAEIFCICTLAYMLVHWCIFYVAQNINSILLAFQEFNPKTQDFDFLEIGHIFDNFKKFFYDLFLDEKIGGYFLKGALYHLVGVAAIPLSWMLSFIIYKKLPGTETFKVILFLPSIISGMVISMLFRYFTLDGFRGIWINVLNRPYNEFPAPLVSDKYALPTLLVFQFFFAMPGSLLINVGTMSRTPVELVEYGKLEGLSLFREFYMVTLPLMFPMLQVTCLGLFVGFFTASGPLYAIYGDGHGGLYMPNNVITFGYYMQTSIISTNITDYGDVRFMYAYTTAANLAIGLFSIPIVWGTKKLFDLLDPEAEF